VQVVGVQLDIAWEDKAANYDRARQLVAEAEPAPGALIVLPEMFATGFSMDVARIAEEPDGPTARMLADLARATGAWVLGGLVTRGPEGKGRNEAHLFGPDATRAARYAKMHPFRYAGETDYYGPGDAVVTVPVGEMVLAPTVCYDLRFPELYRHAARQGADLLAIIANWPAARAAHWRTLAEARAVENQAYVVAVNRTGRDPHHAYAGGSLVLDPRGRALVESGPDEETVRAEVDADAVRAWREEFPALGDLREDLLGNGP
jgi:predicted amidohydrolase